MESILDEKQRMTPSKCSGEIYNKINEINSIKNTWNYNESSEKRVSAKIRKQKQTNKKTRKKNDPSILKSGKFSLNGTYIGKLLKMHKFWPKRCKKE